MEHEITLAPTKAGEFHAKCTCRWTSVPRITAQAAEDEGGVHLKMVQRARAGLGVSRPTLKSQRDYYREMANDEEVDAHDRMLWKQLADELDRRLRDQGPSKDEQATLPFHVAERTRSDIS